MIKIYTLLTFFSFIIILNVNSQISDSAVMTPGYALDVFYSMENGNIQSLSNSDWTVSFSTGSQTASVYINEGKGVELYNTSFDNADFSSFGVSDTAGLSSWTKLHNGYQNWSTSAFESGSTGHPNYGWGDYNSVTHDLVGNKVFLIKTLNNTYYKTSVLSKTSGSWHYRYATLDNSFDTTIVYQASDLYDRNFAYLNMDNHTILNREPVKTDWDLLFTRYYDTNINHTTTGILLNEDVKVYQVDGVSNTSASHSGGTFSENTNTIGSDWKIFDNSSSTFSIVSDRTYFVENQNGDIYKLYFTRFDGTSTGKIIFKTQFISSGANAINENNAISLIKVFPNPTKSKLNIHLTTKNNTSITTKIFNVIGKEVFSDITHSTIGSNLKEIDVSNLTNGVYFLNINTTNYNKTIKFTISK